MESRDFLNEACVDALKYFKKINDYLQKANEKLIAENEELKAKYKTALDDNNTWLDTAFSLENKFNFEKSELEQQISTLESKLEQEMKNPTNDYFIELEKKYKKLNSDFDKLKCDYDEYRYYCEDLEYENEELAIENNKLKTENEKLKAEAKNHIEDILKIMDTQMLSERIQNWLNRD